MTRSLRPVDAAAALVAAVALAARASASAGLELIGHLYPEAIDHRSAQRCRPREIMAA